MSECRRFSRPADRPETWCASVGSISDSETAVSHPRVPRWLYSVLGQLEKSFRFVVVLLVFVVIMSVVGFVFRSEIVMSEMVPLTADEVYQGMLDRKRRSRCDVPIKEQRRVGDLVRDTQREIDLEKAAVNFGLVPPEPAPPKPRRGRPLSEQPARTRCVTPGCPFTTTKPTGLCKRCAAHVNKGNLPEEEK